MRWFVCLLIFLTAAAALPASAQTPALTVIRIAAQPGDEVTPILYALKSGMFAKAGLDVQVQRLASGAAIAAAVAGGSVDIGKSSLIPLITAHDRGIPFTLVAPGLLWLTASPTAGLVALSGTPIASGRDLNGKTLSTSSLKDLGEIGIRSWIDTHGGDSKTVKFVEVPSGAVVATLEAGRVAAGNLVDPTLSDGLASGKIQVIGRPDDAIAKRFLTTAWFADKTFVEKNRTAVDAFERVLLSATAYTNEHQTEMIPIIAPFWGMSPDALASMKRGSNALTLSAADIQPLIDTAARYNAIAKPFDANELIAAGALKARR